MQINWNLFKIYREIIEFIFGYFLNLFDKNEMLSAEKSTFDSARCTFIFKERNFFRKTFFPSN